MFLKEELVFLKTFIFKLQALNKNKTKNEIKC